MMFIDFLSWKERNNGSLCVASSLLNMIPVIKQFVMIVLGTKRFFIVEPLLYLLDLNSKNRQKPLLLMILEAYSKTSDTCLAD